MPAHSTIARLQQLLTLLVAAAAVAWLANHWSRAPLVAVVGAICIICWSSFFLAVEFALLAVVVRDRSVPAPSVWQLVRAWAGETAQSLRVFAWRQPFRWRAIPDQPHATAGGPGIVFVHGYVCNRGFWTPWLVRLRERGVPFVAVNLEPPFGAIEECVPNLEDAVRRMAAATGEPPTLVCHSMGGLVARAWLRTTEPYRVRHVVTIGSPHRGTWLGRFSAVPSARQMRLDSDWLRVLGADASHHGRFTCWYSNCDNVVFPASAATLPGADNRFMPGLAHVELAFCPEVITHTFALAGVQ